MVVVIQRTGSPLGNRTPRFSSLATECGCFLELVGLTEWLCSNGLRRIACRRLIGTAPLPLPRRRIIDQGPGQTA